MESVHRSREKKISAKIVSSLREKIQKFVNFSHPPPPSKFTNLQELNIANFVRDSREEIVKLVARKNCEIRPSDVYKSSSNFESRFQEKNRNLTMYRTKKSLKLANWQMVGMARKHGKTVICSRGKNLKTLLAIKGKIAKYFS